MPKRKKFKTGEGAIPAHRKNDVLGSSESVARRNENALALAERIISIKEARKLLGKTAQSMSDSQIAELIRTLTDVADTFLQDLGSTS